MSTILFLKARGDPEASSTMYGKKAPSSVCFRSAPRLPTVGLGTNSLLAEAAQLYPKLVQISSSQPTSLYPTLSRFHSRAGVGQELGRRNRSTLASAGTGQAAG